MSNMVDVRRTLTSKLCSPNVNLEEIKCVALNQEFSPLGVRFVRRSGVYLAYKKVRPYPAWIGLGMVLGSTTLEWTEQARVDESSLHQPANDPMFPPILCWPPYYK